MFLCSVLGHEKAGINVMPMELISYAIFLGQGGGGGKALVTRDLLFTCHAHGIHRDIYTTKLGLFEFENKL